MLSPPPSLALPLSQSDVPIDLQEVDKSSAVVSHSPPDPEVGHCCGRNKRNLAVSPRSERQLPPSNIQMSRHQQTGSKGMCITLHYWHTHITIGTIFRFVLLKVTKVIYRPTSLHVWSPRPVACASIPSNLSPSIREHTPLRRQGETLRGSPSTDRLYHAPQTM